MLFRLSVAVCLLLATFIAGLLLLPTGKSASGTQSVLPQQQGQRSFDGRFAIVLSAPQHRDAVLAAVAQSTVAKQRGCGPQDFSEPTLAHVWQAPRFDAAGQIAGGVWAESVRATGCGLNQVLNASTIVRAPNVAYTQALAPGTTLADPTLQRDVARQVFQAALAGTPDCRDAYISDTAHLSDGPADDARATGPAHFESWTVMACNRETNVSVELIPDATGTTVMAHS